MSSVNNLHAREHRRVMAGSVRLSSRPHPAPTVFARIQMVDAAAAGAG